MSTEEYLKIVNAIAENETDYGKWSSPFLALIDKIDTLSWAERIRLREDLEKVGCQRLVKNLYYDYEKQAWITK
jgi:hypothetical protein